MSFRRVRRAVCSWRCGWFVCAVGLFSVVLWYMLLVDEDYSMFNHLDTDADPVYHTNHREKHQNRAHFGNSKIKSKHFPVNPGDSRKQLTTPTPLSEHDVIPNGMDFTVRLSKVLASLEHRDLIVSIMDYGFIEMALNFIRTSIEVLDFKHQFLPICLDVESMKTLDLNGYSCLLLDLAENGSHLATDFGTEEYYRKTNVKTWVVLQFLKLGRTVLLSDVDIVLFRNPFSHFTCYRCDIHIQMDRQLYNSGFVYVRNTSAGVALYKTAWDFYLRYHTGHDQAYINMAITALTRNKSITVQELSSKHFPCGAYYFEHDYRHFYNRPPCKGCVMTHNNYMGTTAGKIYRFKENLLWNIDTNGYYSNASAKYITYDNPYDFGKQTIEMERLALINAFVLATLTNRILILPSFRCCNCRTKSCDHPMNRCSLLSVLNVKTFDAVFKTNYREHSFLRNDLVPRSVISSTSPVILFNSTLPSYTDNSQLVIEQKSERKTIVFDVHKKIPSQVSIMDILNDYSSYSVLYLHSMYVPFEFDDVRDSNGFGLLDRFRTGVHCGLYEQWQVSLEDKFFH